MSADLTARPIEALAPQLGSRRLSPVTLTEAFLERIARHDGALSSFVRGRGVEYMTSLGRWRRSG